MKKINTILLLTLALCFVACNQAAKKKASASVQENTARPVLEEKAFDTVVDGKQVKLYWIENDSIKAAFTNYGGRVIGLWVPDRNGDQVDVVTGFKDVEGYINSTEPYFGATIGRVGNRIAKGKFTLNGKEYTIPVNNGENTLHGGVKGFQDIVWDAEQPDSKTLVLRYTSPDMEEGFPGNLEVRVTYSVTADNSLKMEYEATTDNPTPVNLTNHAFFNLNGEGSGSVLQHRVKFYADKFTPVDEGLIPTGELRSVKGTPFDFTDFHTIGERVEADNIQLKHGKGYDHNFVLNGTAGKGMTHAATMVGDKTGITMNVYTEEPGIQFYSGNFMQGKNIFKSSATDDFRTAFALETQHFPDAPNQPDFPSVILNPGEKYHTVSIYHFSISK
ncbi:aldose epimerase family protein [Sinomicrobium weinanense]|uniref:Aldose 1-epimerase n=1 Tax=Sinomicrobium weinanense TaxID=2842200 RepID=A0A926JT84_9FLAO|nr:aldose epimerase family protein [Sinomicrobium weinanense]MBC9797102.1 galactose mutarotase [Sinomicrobium weinanense]MBU3124798.1 galactose mutarotase [Sinomicrobium weinanense]